jgi:hypothetical protein
LFGGKAPTSYDDIFGPLMVSGEQTESVPVEAHVEGTESGKGGKHSQDEERQRRVRYAVEKNIKKRERKGKGD